jgi:hypothetical protein
MNVKALRQAIRKESIAWRKHVLQRLAERGVSQSTVLEVLLNGEKIEDYPNDKPFPSALFLGYSSARPLHVVVALDEASEQAFIITVYEPSLEIFEADYRTRKKK